MIESKIVKELIEALTRSEKKTSAYDTVAEVVRVEDDVAWVHIPGGVDETPVQMSINSRAGDTVRVRVSGGQAWLIGNDTSPPTDDKKAIEAQAKAEEVSDYVATHMKETDDGLVITKDGSGYKLLIASDGIDIIGPTGDVLARYGVEAYIGKDSTGVRISDTSISMSTHGEDLFSVSQIENATILGKRINSVWGIPWFLPGASQTLSEESIVINASHPFKVQIREVGSNGYVYTEYTFTSTGSYPIAGASGTTYYFVISDNGFSLSNPTQVRQSAAITVREYYVTGYSGEFAFGNAFAIDSSGNVKVGFIPLASFEPDATLTTALTALGWLDAVQD